MQTAYDIVAAVIAGIKKADARTDQSRHTRKA
jgi:hypothetical protein